MALPLNSADVLGHPAWFADRFHRIPELHGILIDDAMSSNSNSKPGRVRPRTD